MKIKATPTGRAKRALDKRAPKLVESGRKTLILTGTKTSNVLNQVLTEIYHLKKDSALRFTRKNEGIKPFENGGEASLEFFSLKTDCSLFVYGSHSKKRPNNLVIGRTYDHHIYDLVEVGVENLKTRELFVYDTKLTPQASSKPFIVFAGEGFENSEELKHMKEIILELFRGQVAENLNLVGLDRVYICTALSSNRLCFNHCAMRLKKSGTIIPKIELVEVGPSFDFVVRRHRLPDDSLRKEAMRAAPELSKKKVKNVSVDSIRGKIGKIYVPNQEIGSKALPSSNVKGLKRERRERKWKKGTDEPESKRPKENSN